MLNLVWAFSEFLRISEMAVLVILVILVIKVNKTVIFLAKLAISGHTQS